MHRNDCRLQNATDTSVESPFHVMKRLQKYILDMNFTNFVKIKRFETSIVWLTSLNHYSSGYTGHILLFASCTRDLYLTAFFTKQ